jgi:signal peptidase I
MEDNLLVGDHLLVNKFAFGARGSILDPVLPLRDIHRGDVIVFKYPNELSKNFVKRAIGLPGDHIRTVERQVYVNGEPSKNRIRCTRTREGTSAIHG